MQQVLCANSDEKSVQKYPFLMEYGDNEVEECHQFSFIDLSLWKESEKCDELKNI